MFMERDERVRDYIMPDRVIWTTGETVEDSEQLILQNKAPQASFNFSNLCKVMPGGGFVLDFGKQYHGGIQLIVQCVEASKTGKQAKVRVRFGESAMEAMSSIGEKGATNDHSPRDIEVAVSNLGSVEIGNTAFRFVRIDSLHDAPIYFRMVRTVYLHRDIEMKGSFKSNDELLNKIWEVGAYTVFLNTQEYIWDGAKRDRLVWIGDMHPETSTIQAIFGYDKAVPRSLDLVRDDTPPTKWMNGIPSYSLWWIRIQHDWYMQSGDKEYLKKQLSYMEQLLDRLFNLINEDGTNTIGENASGSAYFIDWPSYTNPEAQRGGVHALMVHSIKNAKEIFEIFGNTEVAKKCGDALAKLAKHTPSTGENKQAASLMALAGVIDLKETNEKLLSVNPYVGVSTFLGYYVLKARAAAGDVQGAIDLARVFWGEMIKLGATTFWEDFNMEWAKGAKPIDSILKEGEYDVHGDNGAYCYKGFRHSLCHGWASGPTAFLSE
ncbi:MAG: alpha-L-rhamnosidase, partial [Bacillota bacterium]|nr:alpha-L-rhamnosidase [Bacillota bacterium]